MKRVLALVVITLLSFTQVNAMDKQRIMNEASKIGISTQVISHVAKRESGYRCSPNNPRYFGPLQISYQSAKALGYKGPKNGLNNCASGLLYGLRHLKLCYNKVGNNPRKAAHCHSSPGSYGVRVSWK